MSTRERYVYMGLNVRPMPGTVRDVAGGRVVDIRVEDSRSTIRQATVSAALVVDEATGSAYEDPGLPCGVCAGATLDPTRVCDACWRTLPQEALDRTRLCDHPDCADYAPAPSVVCARHLALELLDEESRAASGSAS